MPERIGDLHCECKPYCVTQRAATAFLVPASSAETLRIREAQKLEARVEAYNVTNSFRPCVPITNLNASNFGRIETALDPRILQFALKFIF